MQKTEELRQLLQSMWNELDQATSAKYEKMEAEDKTRCVCLRACVFVSASAVLVSDLNRRRHSLLSRLRVCFWRSCLSYNPRLVIVATAHHHSLIPTTDRVPSSASSFLSPPTRYNREMAAFTASASESSKKKKKDE
jgi:hypothetical protein